MQVHEGQVLISPSDITAAAACEFAWLRQLDYKLGRVDSLPENLDPLLERASQLGLTHEDRVLHHLIEEHGQESVVTIDSPGGDLSKLDLACERTLEALSHRKPVVYQGALRDGNLRGFADFLLRNDSGEYVVLDTKLARSAKVSALLQIAAYADILAKRGIPVAKESVLILGGGNESRHDLSTIIPVYRARREALTVLLSDHLSQADGVRWGDATVRACGHCAICEHEVQANRDVLLVAGMRMTQRDRLRDAGIQTIDELAVADQVHGMAAGILHRLRKQARLQLQQESDGQVHFEVFDDQALAAMPTPSPGDIFFDFEGDPMWQDSRDMSWGLEYLFGVVEADTGEFVAFWADDRRHERAALRDFLDYVARRRTTWPDMHIYHYADYERAALLRLAASFGEGEDEIDDLLRGNVLVDLYPVVKGSVFVSQDSYGLKALEALFEEGHRTGDVTTAADSVIQYANYCMALEQGNADEAHQLRKDILTYNEQDCRSTLGLRDWLLALPGAATSSPAVLNPPEVELSDTALAEAAVAEPLWNIAGEAPRIAEEQGFALLAAAVGYHRREEKPFWWGHFDRLSNPPDTWADARDALIIETCEVMQTWETRGRGNPRRTLRVEGVLQAGSCLERDSEAYLLYDCPHPDGQKNAGENTRGYTTAEITLVDQDADRAVFEVEERLPRACTEYDTLPRAAALTPGPPSKVLREAIQGIAARAAAKGLPDPIGNLLRREPPRLLTSRLPLVNGEDYTTAITEAVRQIDGSTLAVQGPPGTGKTYAASHVIARLVTENHWRVGVVSQGHSAVNHLLDCIVDTGLEPALVGKKDRPEDSSWQAVSGAKAAAFLDDHELTGCVYGGTAWDFANTSRVADGLLDLLVIDEAGQFSLANTIAVSRSCQRVVLLGDPQQLPEVSQGTHPEPVDMSALGWLTPEAILPAEYGYFLHTTRRMHPRLCEPVSVHSYAGRLRAHECAAERRMLGAGGDPIEPGLVVEALEHSGNSVASVEEAARIADLAREALSWRWQPSADESTRIMTPADVLVVAPYNAQVDLLRHELAGKGLADVRVGTVDKFQGQEAPVVLASMTASSPDDVPRGMEFLLCPNRINVAASRAQWRTVIVHGSRLTDYLPTRPERLDELGRFLRLTRNESREC